MPEFRKKPIVIEAIQWDGTLESYRDIQGMSKLESFCYYDRNAGAIEIDTLEGIMYAMPNDWIIKGVKGEFYPCKDEIFRETYEPVSD